MEAKTSDPSYWDNLYQSHDTAWDVGYPTTPMKDYIDQLADKSISILIPGCGNGYEAQYLLENGFNNVALVDISPSLTGALEKKLQFCREFYRLRRMPIGSLPPQHLEKHHDSQPEKNLGVVV